MRVQNNSSDGRTCDSYGSTSDSGERFDNVEKSLKEFDKDNNKDTGPDVEPTEPLICGYTRQKIKIFISLCLVSFTDVIGYSVFAPFFPNVARMKNISFVQIGVIFASYSISGFFASILTGTMVVNIGAKFIVISGMFLASGSIMLFSVLKYTSGTTFLILSIACRVVMGFGNSAAFTAIYAVIFQEYVENSFTVIGIAESLTTFGGLLAPLLGGAFYQIGGFELPFLVLGGIQLFIVFVCCFTLPSVSRLLASAVVCVFNGPTTFVLNWFGWSQQQQWLMYLTSALGGGFFGAVMMPTLSEMFISAETLQLCDNELAQYGLVSGLWNAAFSVGDILGPTVGGSMEDNLGYGDSSGIFGAMFIALALLQVAHYFYQNFSQTCKSNNFLGESGEKENLLTADEATVQ